VTFNRISGYLIPKTLPIGPYGKADLISGTHESSIPAMAFKRVACHQLGTFINIPDYPPVEDIIKEIKKIRNHKIINADAIARDSGSSRSGNMVMLGAASPYIDMPFSSFENAVRKLFARKGDEIVEMNLKALRAGRDA
jgi:indolepyruvate ferredoxin oxidoreductase beta subunit